VLLAAFRAVYEAFFELPWANESERGAPVGTIAADSSAHPFDALAAAIPTIVFAGAATGGFTVDDLVATCRRQVEVDIKVDEVALQANVEPTAEGASAVLLALAPPLQQMPSLLRSRGDRWRHDILLNANAKLSTAATRIAAARAQGNTDDEAWLAVLRSAIEFSVSLTEFKVTMLGRDAARLIASGNVLGAALVVRAILEHHAVAIELGEKLRGQWERLAKAQVAKDEKVTAYLREAEKQLARTLASSPASTEGTTRWRDLWRESVCVYHIMDPVKALDAEEPGFLKTYGLLSHLIHGTVATGGDLLGSGGAEPRRHFLVQLVVFLHSVLQPHAVMDRVAVPALISHRIDGWEKTAGVSLAARVDKGRVPAGQKLKPRKDVFGTGTREDPFRFREGLLYHENHARYLSELGIEVKFRQLAMLENGVGDEVFTSDGRTLYFLNDKLKV
jgi:hypothetical protein